MTAAEKLRARAAALREQAAEAAKDCVRVAREMAAAGSASEYESLELDRQVLDCMNRRFGQWAGKLDEAAYELENP